MIWAPTAGPSPYFDYPRIPGHEFSAEVIEADQRQCLWDQEKGMIVTCNPYFNCGRCHFLPAPAL